MSSTVLDMDIYSMFYRAFPAILATIIINACHWYRYWYYKLVTLVIFSCLR